YLNAHINAPVPEIEQVDFTVGNKLGQRYSIQRRFLGAMALTAYPKLNVQQKICYARQF
ncbi:hypothetical protein K469DRAFT_459637, partial [Zopfia rhizophila CBS 207.26]